MNPRSICVSATLALTLASAIVLAEGQSAASGIVTIQMQTTEGDIVLQLDGQKAPKSVANFLKYAESGHYNDTVFHRVIEGFMIQGGGLDRNLKEKDALPPIENEASNGLKNEKYTIAMARSGDPHSATSQFFINVGNNDFLNRDQAQDGYGYAVFGKVVKGQDVVERISTAPTQVQPDPLHPARLLEDVPAKQIVLKAIRVVPDDKR